VHTILIAGVSAVLAHEGAVGLDEVLTVAAPLVLVGGGLWAANRWANGRS